MNKRIITIKKKQQEKKYFISSVQQTSMLAKDLVRELHGGDVVALSGNVGSGKTTFTQCLARSLGVKSHVTSPTFVLMNIYDLVNPIHDISVVCHIDTYRLESLKEFQAIGAEEYIGRSDTLTIIEWPAKVKSLLPKDTIWISFELGDTLKMKAKR